MSFLDNLFTRSATPEIEIAEDQITADAEIEAGFLYEVAAGGTDLELTLGVTSIAAVAGKRIGVKVVGSAEGPGELLVIVPDGMYIEDDSGILGEDALIDGGRLGGNYREWLCDASGVWLMVVGAAGGDSGLTGVAVSKGGTLVGTRAGVNFIEGFGTKLTLADDSGEDRVDVTIAAKVENAATNFAWSSNAASIDVSAARHFVATNALAGNSTLTLTGGVDGCRGKIYVKQDATGNRTLAFSISGRTVLKDLNVADTNPLGTASSYTVYEYSYETIVSGAVVVLLKGFLQ